jgi:membrane protease YdiL (CAAX protease family)
MVFRVTGAALPAFWILAFVLAWALSIPSALATHGIVDLGLPQGALRLMGFAPAIAAIVAALATGRLQALAGRVFTIKASPLLYLAAVALPALFLAASVAASPYVGAAAPKVVLAPQIMVFAGIWFVLALGEEIGWRAFALPQLTERYGFWKGASILGIVWAVWHYPMLLASPFIPSFETGVVWFALFTVQIVLANFVLCWLMARSGAVLVPTLFHTAFNVVATLHLMAAVDLVVTVAMALAVLFVLLFDAEPRREPAD